MEIEIVLWKAIQFNAFLLHLFDGLLPVSSKSIYLPFLFSCSLNACEGIFRQKDYVYIYTQNRISMSFTYSQEEARPYFSIFSFFINIIFPQTNFKWIAHNLGMWRIKSRGDFYFLCISPLISEGVERRGWNNKDGGATRKKNPQSTYN